MPFFVAGAGIPAPEQPPAPPRFNLRPVDQFVARNLDFRSEEETAAKAILRLGGEDAEKIVYGELPTTPITPEEAADPIALERKRLALKKEAEEIKKLKDRKSVV